MAPPAEAGPGESGPSLSPIGVGYCARCATGLELRWQEDRDRPTCPACGLVVYVDPKVAVAVVVGGPAGILLGRRNIDPGRGAWSFPAGYVNSGEVLEEAAVREVREELGVEVRLGPLVGVYSAAGDPVILVVYDGTLISGPVQPDGREVSEAAMFPLDSLPTMAFRHDAQIIQDWRFARASEAGRQQSGMARAALPTAYPSA
ncbi:MAG: NUDIX hydrolase [Chloroflexi bacterium]|nr:NUDIX hydrolase [Chloroflexota bacterium]